MVSLRKKYADIAREYTAKPLVNSSEGIIESASKIAFHPREDEAVSRISSCIFLAIIDSSSFWQKIASKSNFLLKFAEIIS
jgi:hypothetical protein